MRQLTQSHQQHLVLLQQHKHEVSTLKRMLLFQVRQVLPGMAGCSRQALDKMHILRNFCVM